VYDDEAVLFFRTGFEGIIMALPRKFSGLSLRKKIIYGFLLLMLLAYVMLLGIYKCMEDRFLYYRRSVEMGDTPAHRGWLYEDVFVETSDGRSCGWWIPLEGARGVVLFSHGSGRNNSHYLRDAELYRACGFSVLLYDYGGYGRSEGKSSEARCYEDGLAFYKYLLEVRKIPAERIVLAGASLGSGITTRLATEIRPGAMILEAAFTSFPDAQEDAHWVGKIVLPQLFAKNRFPNLERIRNIYCPVLIVHSPDDGTIPFSHGERLYEAAPGSKTFLVITGGHGGGKFSSGALYADGLCAFLEEHIAEEE
jgi:pimeloyl-ACP methyl ester carboxylesterase